MSTTLPDKLKNLLQSLTHTMKTLPFSLTASLVAAMFISSADAAVVAYWRFEEGTLGSPVPASSIGGDPFFDNTVIDSSGNGNHMRTFWNSSAPTYVAGASAIVPQTGATNTLSLQMNPDQDIYTPSKPINTFDFSGGFTIEASILSFENRFQVFVGKDGKPTSNPQGPFWIKGLNDGRLEVGMIDTAEVFHGLLTPAGLSLNEWYHVAAIHDGTTFSFYLKGPSDSSYNLISSATTAGGLINSDGSWTIGRGVWDGNLADWVNGRVDEVRISDVALSTSQLLFVPEPSTAVLLLAGAGWLLIRHRRFRPQA